MKLKKYRILKNKLGEYWPQKRELIFWWVSMDYLPMSLEEARRAIADDMIRDEKAKKRNSWTEVKF